MDFDCSLFIVTFQTDNQLGQTDLSCNCPLLCFLGNLELNERNIAPMYKSNFNSETCPLTLQIRFINKGLNKQSTIF